MKFLKISVDGSFHVRACKNKLKKLTEYLLEEWNFKVKKDF